MIEITKDTIIGDILDVAPQTAPIFLSIGMHCLGCPSSRGETVEEACAVHGIDVEETDVIVIAGMGGETIIAILSAAPWTRNGHMLLLQPMTKAADLRHWLIDNGYTFTAECLVEDKGRVYPILTVTGGAHRSLTEAEALCGILLEGDPLYGAYLAEHAARLRRSAEGLRRSSDPNGPALAAQADALAAELEEKRDAI